MAEVGLRTTNSTSEVVRYSPLDSGFVGREAEVALLRDLAERANAGAGSLLLLVGEPGIGKTRLAEEGASIGAGMGAQVLWGRCWEGGGAPAFWPWIQVLRSLLGERAVGRPKESQDEYGELAHLMRQAAPTAINPSVFHAQLEPRGRESRFLVFDDMVRVLTQASRERLILVIVEDIHWADMASLALLSYLAGQLRSLRLLLIGTLREAEKHPSDPLYSALGQVVRHRTTWPLRLAPLTQHEVVAFIAKVTGVQDNQNLAASLFRRSGGNPLFLVELMRSHLSGSILGGGPESVPKTLIRLIERRVDSLSDVARQTLRAAAVIGQSIRERELSFCARLPRKKMMTAIDELTRVGLIVENDSHPEYRFSHAIVGESLYCTIPRGERRALHYRIARMMEQDGGARPMAPVTQIAQHFLRASELAPRGKRLSWALRAARETSKDLAFEDASTYYSAALTLFPKRQRKRRFETLLALGAVQNAAGRCDEAKRTFLAAARIAQSQREFATAALGYRGPLEWTVRPDPVAIRLLQQALGRLSTCARTRVLLIGALVKELYSTADESRRGLLADEAESIARAADDEVALAHALEARIYSRWGPHSVRETMDAAAAMIQVATSIGEVERMFRGHLFRFCGYLQLGELERAQAEFDACAQLTREINLPRYSWRLAVLQVGMAITHGEFARALEGADEAYRSGLQVHEATATQYRILHAFLLARLKGSIQEVHEDLVSKADSDRDIFLYQLGVAWVERMRGEGAMAQRVLARVLCNRLKDVRRDAFHLFTLCELAELSFAEGHRDVAELLYEEMKRYEGHFAVVSWGVACNGATDHYLGMLATTLERWGDAEAHFDSALLMNRRLNSPPFVARTQHSYADMLSRTGRRRDCERAIVLLRDAVNGYERLGMKGYLREAELLTRNVQNGGAGSTMWVTGSSCMGGARVQEGVGGGAGGAVPTTGVALVGEERATIAGRMTDNGQRVGGNVFRREGDYWTLVFEGKVSRFKDKRGLQYLAYLLANPFKQVHSMDLASGVGGKGGDIGPQGSSQKSAIEGLRQSRLGDVGPALDARARSDYRRRLAELREELEEAEAFNDLGRVTILRRELEELTSYLTAACRPGRGARLAGSYSERARVSVRNNIASAVRAIRGHDDALGRHLSNAVRTGTFCSYTPDRKIRWDF